MAKEAQRGCFDISEGYDIIPKGDYIPDSDKNRRMKNYLDKDDSLLPAEILMYPADEKYSCDKELHRTMATCAVTKNGRIFAAYNTGTEGEEAGSYDVILYSDDDGENFEKLMVINPAKPDTTRVFDMMLWVDDENRFWIFYAQTYMSMDGRLGVWCIRCDKPDAQTLEFTQTRRISNGNVVAKPVVLSSGEWLLPVHLYSLQYAQEENALHSWVNYLPDEIGSHVLCSRDKGETF